jgi:hypothetical protein
LADHELGRDTWAIGPLHLKDAASASQRKGSSDVICRTEFSKLTFEGNLYTLTNYTQFLVGHGLWQRSFGTVSGQANSSRDVQLSLRLEF